jgi:hypothetical protein
VAVSAPPPPPSDIPGLKVLPLKIKLWKERKSKSNCVGQIEEEREREKSLIEK